jgi:hypothetical protein
MFSLIIVIDNFHRKKVKKYTNVLFIGYNVIFNCQIVQSVLLMEETGITEEYHQPATCHWQTLSHNIVASTPRNE